jgi:hypothetical protein
MEELRSLPKNKSKIFIVSFYCVSNLWFLLVQIQSSQFSILDEKEFPIGNKCLAIKQRKSYLTEGLWPYSSKNGLRGSATQLIFIIKYRYCIGRSRCERPITS